MSGGRHFTQLPDWFVDSSKVLGLNAYVVYIAYLKHRNYKTGEAYPTIPVVCRASADLGDRTVQKAINHLLATRLDERTALMVLRGKRTGGRSAEGGNGTLYYLPPLPDRKPERFGEPMNSEPLAEPIALDERRRSRAPRATPAQVRELGELHRKLSGGRPSESTREGWRKITRAQADEAIANTRDRLGDGGWWTPSTDADGGAQ